MEIEGKDFNSDKLLDLVGYTVKYSPFNQPFLTTN